LSIIRTNESVEPVAKNSQHWFDVKASFLDAQDGQCAICLRAVDFEDAQLDHCHATGFIRGVLCVSCNTKLGFYETRRKEIETYLAVAAEHAAYITVSSLPRAPREPRPARAERWRAYWQGKAID
jgi:hypothetical protein